MYQVFDDEIDDAISAKFATREEAEEFRAAYVESMGLTKKQAEEIVVENV
jgi:hypothetical protein